MSQVQLQVQPRRVRCSTASEPPPFSFAVAPPGERPSTAARIALLPLRSLYMLLVAIGKLIDAGTFLVGITIWCALHLTVWSYAFQMGPAANCFTLPCPSWIASKVVIACIALAIISFTAARILNKLGHRATSMVLLLLVTLDLSALLLLGVRSLL
ncbi:MAG: hypothetical protein ABI200_04000 [Gaiellales bacterium]